VSRNLMKLCCKVLAGLAPVLAPVVALPAPAAADEHAAAIVVASVAAKALPAQFAQAPVRETNAKNRSGATKPASVLVATRKLELDKLTAADFGD